MKTAWGNVYCDSNDRVISLEDAIEWLAEWVKKHSQPVLRVSFEKYTSDKEAGWYVYVYYFIKENANESKTSR